MGLKRITARIEITYPADDPRTLQELREETPEDLAGIIAVNDSGSGMVLAAYGHLNAAVDPDPEPTLPDAPPGPEGVRR